MKNLLVDSATYIDLMRADIDVRQLLIPYIRSARLYGCGVVRAEVLRGISAVRVREGMEAFFDIIPEVPCDVRLWRDVAELGWKLGRKGKWPPVTDLAIAVCALRAGAAVVTPDRHFHDVPGLLVLGEIP